MSITSLSELETAVADRIARSDFSTGQIDECIASAESEMQRTLRAVDMETKNVSFTIDDEFVDVPTDFLEVRSFWYLPNGVRKTIYYMSDEMQPGVSSGCGRLYYSIVGGQFHFAPAPSSSTTATLIYYALIPPLVAVTNTSNWMLTKWPDAYLYGALKHAAIRVKDSQAAQGYDSIFQSALQQIQWRSNRARTGSGMVTRPA